jgi:hypothetical protein
MNFDTAHEMSGKSIASAITTDDAAVKPRCFRWDGAELPGKIVGADAEEARDLVAQGRRRSRQCHALDP